MASLLTTIPHTIFPYEIDYLKLSSDCATRIEMLLGGKTILDTTLFPFGGFIELFNLSSLIIDCMEAEIKILIIQIDGSEVASTNVIPNTMDLDLPGTECFDIFLTRGTSKYTHPAAKEILTYVDNGDSAAIITAVIRKEGKVTTTRKTLSLSSSGSGIVSLDVSPAVIFSIDDYDLIQYTVTMGSRSMTYRMIPDGMADTLHEYGFINSFMQEEYVTLMGEAERELKMERQHAYIGGQYQNFQVLAIPHWTIKAILPDGMEGVFDDLVTSKEVWRKDDFCRMAITDSKNVTLSSSSAINEGSITLRETGRTYRHRPVRPVKTFDETFDDTFQ